MNYTTICDYIINYLIDKTINFSKNDTTKQKIKKCLLKYKRIIAIFLLIVLLYIGNQCNLSYLNFKVNHKKDYVLNGGSTTPVAPTPTATVAPVAPVAPTAAVAPVEDKRNRKEKTYDFGAKYANKLKDNASVFYGFLYSIAITILMFLIFVPAVGFIVIGFICYSLLKTRIISLKSL